MSAAPAPRPLPAEAVPELQRLLARLLALATQLHAGAQAFLARPADAPPADLALFLEERDLALAEWRELLDAGRRLVEEGTAPAAGDEPDPQAWLAALLGATAPAELGEPARHLRDRLTELVAADRAVQQRLLTLREDLRKQLGLARQGGRLLKGYTPVDPLDSCFVDRRR